MESQAPYRTLQPGEMLNWYRIERILGRGGFGVIYLATDTNLDHQVAIKEYIPGDVATRSSDSKVHPITEEHGDMFRWGMDRFIKEARNLVKFKHPNIVRVMSVFQENNTAYMVMEFEEGEDLRSYLRKPGGNSEQSLKHLILPISKGLAEVHRHGFIHRDIKPANILVRKDGSPVLLDFGSARNANKFTQQSLTALVSVGYAPLEQYNSEADEQQGPWTDIYALGGTLYNAISGRDPVESTRRGAALLNGGADPLIAAEYLGEGKYSQSFLRAVDWAMKFAIADRPQTLSDWIPALLATDTDPSGSAGPTGPTSAMNTGVDTKTMDELSDATVLSRERRTAQMEKHRAEGQRGHSSSAKTASDRTSPSAGTGLRGLALLTLLLSGVALALWFTTDSRKAISDTPAIVEGQPTQGDQTPVGNVEQNQAAAVAAAKLQRARDEEAKAQALQEQQRAEQKQQAAEAEQQRLADEAAAAEQKRLAAERLAAEKNAAEATAIEAARKAAEAKAVETKAAEDAAATLLAKKQAEEKRAADKLAKEQAAIKAEKARVREAKLVAQQAAARQERRLKQTIGAAQNSLSVGDLTAAQQQLSNAQSIDAEDARVQTLAFAVQRAQDEHNQPVSDADFDTVARMFDGLRRAIETKDAVALDRLAVSSQQTAIFKSLMKSFERLDVSISNLRVRNADKSISAVLKIDAMVRENGDRATPSDKYATRPIISRRVNGGWSKIEW